MKIIEYGDEVTANYEQFQRDWDWFYSTISETLFVNLRELTKSKRTLKICDIGCGDGNNCRMVIDRLDELAADSINMVGIDLSPSQIALAKSKTKSEKYIDIDFEVGSAQNIPYREAFDVAFSMWPFSYAKNVEVLQEMMTSCFECLKPGGVCIGATPTMKDPNTLSEYAKIYKDEFDLEYEYPVPLKDGDPLIQHCGTLHFEEVFYSQTTYDKVARAAGFTEGIDFLDPKSIQFDTRISSVAQEKAKTYFLETSHPAAMFVLFKCYVMFGA